MHIEFVCGKQQLKHKIGELIETTTKDDSYDQKQMNIYENEKVVYGSELQTKKIHEGITQK